MEFLNAIVALSNYILIPAIAYGSQLGQGRNKFSDTGQVLLANPEVRRSFLRG